MTDNTFATVRAFPVQGVGGFVTATSDGAETYGIITVVLPSGDQLQLACDDEMLAAFESKALELRAELMGARETLRELGL